MSILRDVSGPIQRDYSLQQILRGEQIGACCTEFLGSRFCSELSNEESCIATGGYFLPGVPCDPDPCNCPSPPYSVFEVQLRIYGTLNFGICNGDCSGEEFDSQTFDYTLNINDNGYIFGYAEGNFSDIPFYCGEDLYALATLTCLGDGICNHGDAWELRLFFNLIACNNELCIPCMVGYPGCDGTPGAQYVSRVEAGVYDTDCEFNATYVTVLPDLFPFPNGTYSGTTSMTAQGDSSTGCAGPPFPNRDFGSLSIDWTVIIAP